MTPLKILLLSFLLLALPISSCMAQTYSVTEQELTRLETIFEQLESNNKQQEQKLLKASELLMKSEQQILSLSERLTKAEQSINQAQNSLQKANESLSKYEKETQAEIKALKLQRTILGATIAYLLIKK